MNIDDLQHNSFEEQWQNAFVDASMTPPEGVWEKIEVSLDKNIQPKSGDKTYYLGAISALILSIALWYFIQKEDEVKPLQIIENKPIVVEKKEEVLPQTVEASTTKPKENVVVKKIRNFAKEEDTIEPQVIENHPEEIKRNITDSVDFITPISPKQIPLDFTITTPEFHHEQTPYYEKPKPKPKKKPIFRNVRISGGIGVYQ